jgi:hypothetical protein
MIKLQDNNFLALTGQGSLLRKAGFFFVGGRKFAIIDKRFNII